MSKLKIKSFAVFLWFSVITCVAMLIMLSCGTSNNYVEGNTQVSVEYFGESIHNTCYPNFVCEVSTTACAVGLYEDATKTAGKGVMALRKEDYRDAAYLFSYALCTIINIDKVFEQMKTEDNEAWREHKRSGFIEEVRMTGLKIGIVIDQIKELNK